MGEAAIGSKGSKPITTTTNQTQTSTPASWVASALPNVYGQAQGAPSQYTLPAQPVAGFSPDQIAAFQGVQNIQGMAQPYFNAATGEALQGSSPITGGTVSNYLNPMANYVMANLQDVFGQQMRDVTGRLTQAAGGVGADRIGVGQSNLAKQQGLAAGQTLANMWTPALQAAQTDAARQLQGSQLLAMFGPAAQGAQLQGLQALLGTGGMQQQLSQAQQQSLYNLLQNQFGFQFQRPQYEAGILGATGPLAGGTTTGQGTSTTTYPPPSALSQILGGGLGLAGLTGGLKGSGSGGGLGGFGGIGNALSGLGSGIGSALGGLGEGIGSALSFIPMMFSDKRLKENVKEVGRLHDGQKIYRYNFKGDPRTQVGLLSQEVERHHPEAVHKVGGLGAVDYDAATEDAAQHRQLGGAANYMQSSVVPAMQLAMHQPQFPRLDLRLEHAKQAEDPMADFKKLGLSMLGRQRPSAASPTDDIDEGVVGGEAAPEYSAYGGPVRAMGGQVFGSLPGGFSDGMGANMPGMQGMGVMPFMQAAQIQAPPSASNVPGQGSSGGAVLQPYQRFQSGGVPMMQPKGAMGSPPSPQPPLQAPGLGGGNLSAMQNMVTGINNIGRDAGGGVSFGERFPSEDRTTDASGMSASKGPQMPIIRNPRELRAALERQIPTIQGRRLGRALENFQFGGGTGFDAPMDQDLYDPHEMMPSVDVTNLGLGKKPNWSPEQDRALAFVKSGKPPPDTDTDTDTDEGGYPAKFRTVADTGTSPLRKPTGFPPKTDPFGAYPGPQEMPADKVPYPRSRERNWGSDISESPWSALARAGFSMMAGTSPYAGVNIGRGALEGLKGLDEQRSAGMKEEEVNLQAKRLWQQMQQEADKYRYMTPAQKLNALQQERLYQKQIEQLELEGLKPFVIDSTYDPDTGVEKKTYGIRDRKSGEIVPIKIDPKTGKLITGTAAPEEPEDRRGQLTEEFRKRDEAEPLPLGTKELKPDLVPTPSQVQGPAKGPFAVQSAATMKAVDADMTKKRVGLEVQRDQLTRLKQDYATVMADNEKDGFFTKLLTLPGADPESRIDAAKKANLAATAAGRPPVFNPQKIAAIEEAIKIQKTMGMSFAATISPRDAMQMQMASISAQPGFTQSPAGMLRLIGLYDGLTTHGENEQKFWGRWKQVNPRTSAGWEEDFRSKNASDKTTVRAMLENIPNQEAKRLLPKAIERLRANPSKEEIDNFNRVYQGTASFFLNGRFDPYVGLQ